LLLPGKKTILTIHDVGRYSGLKGIKKWLYYQLYFFWPSLRANAITTVSEFTKGELNKLVSKTVFKKITVIHNPVPLLFENRPVLPIGQKGTVLQVGTGFHKNLESVILAMTGSDYTLNIIGSLTSDQITLLEKCKVKYNSFMNISYEEVYNCYVNSDVVIFISQYEGFGMPVLEAQACGRPVIVSSLASLPEVAGMGAHYIEQYDDTTEVSEAIKKVFQDDDYRKELVERGLANVQRFSREKIIRAYLDLYKAMA
jgi:glycosyltransferase involved in cell wall biosynthesis